jgi:CDP-glucose 4,6-dehydratase
MSGPVLVTGHTGFKGTWLTLLLQELNIPVVGYALAAENDSIYTLLNRKGQIPELIGDIRDSVKVSTFIKEYKPTIVIHLAAQALVLESYIQPVNTFETNVMGTVNVLAASFACESVKSICVITTDKVYENRGKNSRFRENDNLRGKDPYSASKVATESVCDAWRTIQNLSGGPNIIVARAGNVIGGGDKAMNRLLPDVIRSYWSKSKLEIRSPDSTRPWQHVLDPLWGYLLAINESLSLQSNSTYNFGPTERGLSVREVMKVCSQLLPNELTFSFKNDTDQQDNKEARYLDLDSDLAQRELDWSPEYSQVEAIQSTISWWSSKSNNENRYLEVTKKDISEFINKKSVKRN